MAEKCVFVMTRDPAVDADRFAFLLRHKVGAVLLREVPAITDLTVTLLEAGRAAPTVDLGGIAHPAEAAVETWAQDATQWDGVVARLQEISSTVQAWRVRQTTIWDYSEPLPPGRAPWPRLLMFLQRLAGKTHEEFAEGWAGHARLGARLEEHLRDKHGGSLAANLYGLSWRYRQNYVVDALTDTWWPIDGYAEIDLLPNTSWFEVTSVADEYRSDDDAPKVRVQDLAPELERVTEEPWFTPPSRTIHGEYWVARR